MRVTIVSTYPPRACGIGTFSRDLRSALIEANPGLDVDVMAIVRDQRGEAAVEVASAIRQDVRADYVSAAARIEERGTDVVLIEHEYGIFGGGAGAFVLSLVAELEVPYVVTLHTVLSAPSPEQLQVLRPLCQGAALVTVFTETARRMVVDDGVVRPDQVRVVPHGAPVALLPGATVSGGAIARSVVGHLEGRTVLSTFGLISASKGIETAIEALVHVVPTHPEVLYLVAGQTHPEVISSEGERYRLSLQRLIRDRGLERNVHFLDHFLTTEELAVLLSSTDLYLTPYRSREQIVSGALTFAVVAGCPVVSTGYFYAEDLLASGAGVLVPFDEPEAFAEGVLHFLDDRDALAAAAREAQRVGAGLTWPAVGAQTVFVLNEAVQMGAPAAASVGSVRLAWSPSVRPHHLLTLVDDVGIVQHADGVIPIRSTGYCVDDMARLVIVAVGLDRERYVETFDQMVTLGLSFLRHAWDNEAVAMHNFMSYDRQWLDDPHSGDHLGRAVWALGVVIAAHPPRAVTMPSLRLLERMTPAIEALSSLRAIAFAAMGLCRPPLPALPGGLRVVLESLGMRLLDAYRAHSAPGWHWFEDSLTYDNARLAQGLIAVGDRLGNEEMKIAGLEALDWYLTQCRLDGDIIGFVGNKWQRRADSAEVGDSDGDEQPLEAAALVESLADALTITGRREYGDQAVHVFEWFLGRNRLGQPIYDFATGGCHDGLATDHVNENEGAESTLAYFQALLALEAAGLQGSLPVA